MKALFVTGTGTDIGKTYVSAAIAACLVKKHLKIAYYKAALSGALSTEDSDAGFVYKQAGLNQDPDTLLSYRYEKPLSPHLAARGEGKYASLDRIIRDFKSLGEEYDYVLSEGAGGIVCPVVYEPFEKLFYSDIAKAMQAPCVVVADAGLGTINHTVLTVEYIRNHGLTVAGVILNRYDENSSMHRDNLEMIEAIAHCKVIAVLPYGGSELQMREKSMEEYFGEV